jgi:hypothetical protein
MSTKPPNKKQTAAILAIVAVVVLAFVFGAFATGLFSLHAYQLERIKASDLQTDSVPFEPVIQAPTQPAPSGAAEEFHVPLGPPPPGDWVEISSSADENREQGFYLDYYHYIGSDGTTSQLTAEGTPFLNNRELTLGPKEWVIKVEAFFEKEAQPDMKACLDLLNAIGPGATGPEGRQLGIFGHGSYTLFREKESTLASRLDVRFNRLTRCEWMPQPAAPPSFIEPLVGTAGVPSTPPPAPATGGYDMKEQGFYLYLPDTFTFEGNTVVMKANGTPVLENRTLTTSPNSWTIPLKVTFLDKNDPGTEKCFGTMEEIKSGMAGDRMNNQQLAVFGPGSYTLNRDARDENEFTGAVLSIARVTHCDWMPMLEPPPHTHDGPPLPMEEMDMEMRKEFLPDPVSPNLRFMNGMPVPPGVQPPFEEDPR